MSLTRQPERLARGLRFGHYAIVRHLGSGGMGSVYEASHVTLGKRVALKTLLPEFAANPDAQTRFLREGQLAAKLQHPHVVDVADFGIEHGIAYLVMEFVEGESLETLLGRNGRLSPHEIADVMVPVIAAVASAHDQQIVHRDLKPDNIFLTYASSGERVPKVLDFGISKLLNDGDGANLTGSMNLLGTPVYMSPEQTRSAKHVDDRSDQYALAVILYECVTGELPFRGDSVFQLVERIAEGRFAPPSERVAGLPPGFEGLVLRGMAQRPADRFATTWELGAALLPFASLRNQVLWEPEFKGKSSTFVGPPTKRTASSAAIRPVAAPVPAADLAAVTSLDLRHPLAPAPSEPQATDDAAERPTQRVAAIYQGESPRPKSRIAIEDDLAMAGLGPRPRFAPWAVGLGLLALVLAGLGWMAARS